MDEKRFWFHITEENWGSKVKLYPRRCLRGESVGEPDTPRICVCPSMIKCYIATNWEVANRYVYRTVRRCSAVPAVGVYDSHITNEHWLLKPTTFKLHRIQDLLQFPEPYVHGGGDEEILKRQLNVMEKLEGIINDNHC